MLALFLRVIKVIPSNNFYTASPRLLLGSHITATALEVTHCNSNISLVENSDKECYCLTEKCQGNNVFEILYSSPSLLCSYLYYVHKNKIKSVSMLPALCIVNDELPKQQYCTSTVLYCVAVRQKMFCCTSWYKNKTVGSTVFYYVIIL